MPLISIDPERQAEIQKATDLANLDFWWANVIADGWPTPDGWRLGLTEQDVSLLTGVFVLAKEADAAGAALPPVIDKDGVPRTFSSLEDMTAMMLAYGQARAELSAEYASRRAAIG
jgi:hypothetical protein